MCRDPLHRSVLSPCIRCFPPPIPPLARLLTLCCALLRFVALCCRVEQVFFLYFTLFHVYFFSFPFGFSYLALVTTVLFLQHSMLFCWNRYEASRVQQRASQQTSQRWILHCLRSFLLSTLSSIPPDELSTAVLLFQEDGLSRIRTHTHVHTCTHTHTYTHTHSQQEPFHREADVRKAVYIPISYLLRVNEITPLSSAARCRVLLLLFQKECVNPLGV